MGTSGDSKRHHVTVRMGADQVEVLDTLGEAWGITKDDGTVNRSATLRLVTEAFGGVLTGRFFAIVDNDKLAKEWGAVGQVLALANEADGDMPTAMREARLADVLKPAPDLVGAGRLELHDDVEVPRGDGGG